MTLQQASRKIAYKYVVVRPQGYGKPPKNIWECLIDFKPLVRDHVNRCLHIRDDSLKGNGKSKYQLIFAGRHHHHYSLSWIIITTVIFIQSTARSDSFKCMRMWLNDNKSRDRCSV